MSLQLRRIPFEGIYNFRDLGGYATPEGATQFGKVFRCDSLSDLSEQDSLRLEGLGIKMVLDLRTSFENERHPSAFAGGGGVAYHNISLLEEIVRMQGHGFKPGKIQSTEHMQQLYYALLEHAGDKICSAIKLIAQNIGSPLVFHCSEGKDRTGLIAAFLLSICGVADADIIADYQVSHTYITHKYETDPRYAGGHAVDTPPGLMRGTLAALSEHYGGALPYLRHTGVSDSDIAAIREGMVVKG